MTIRESKSRKVFLVFNYIFLLFIAFITIAPFVVVIASSLSGLTPLAKGEVYLIPKDFTLDGYIEIFKDGSIFRTYYNTIWYTVVGVLVSVTMTMGAAYPLSRRAYALRSQVMVMITVTMFFSGGMVPSFILVRQIGLYDTRWAMVLPGAVSAFNLVMARVFLQSNIPEEMSEAAKIDGANDIQVFFRIVLPLSKAIIAVLALYYGVGIWNNYYSALLYITNPDYQPLAMYLRHLLVVGSSNSAGLASVTDMELLNDPVRLMALTERIKYASIIVTMVPIMCVYPFVQKYFTKGVMIGALKE